MQINRQMVIDIVSAAIGKLGPHKQMLYSANDAQLIADRVCNASYFADGGIYDYQLINLIEQEMRSIEQPIQFEYRFDRVMDDGYHRYLGHVVERT